MLGAGWLGWAGRKVLVLDSCPTENAPLQGQDKQAQDGNDATTLSNYLQTPARVLADNLHDF
jgi:hypothetical protein